MNKGLALVGMLGLIVAFQNCSQETLTSSSNDFNSNEVAVTLPGDEKQSAKITFVEIPDLPVAESMAKLGQSLRNEEEAFKLVISVESGALQILDQGNAVMDKGCLSSSDLEELKSILGGSRICKSQASQQEICAQIYKPGYAALYADDDKISLGEERDSCGNGKQDLCGELSSVFQAYVAHIKNNWSKMSCE